MSQTAVIQLFRYAVVGLLSNALLYAAYLGLTGLGLDPKFAMTALYLVGIVQTFIFNQRWTFSKLEHDRQAFYRYVLLYAVGYCFNWLMLELLVGHIGWPHQWVMLGLMLFMVAFFFLGQKFWVFRTGSAA